MTVILPLLLVLLMVHISPICSRSFTIDWDNDQFLKDGKPFAYHSGGMHYFRVPREYWKDRMYKMKLAGMNTLQTYISWNNHEAEEDKYDFEGDNNITEYLSLAQSMGFNVVFRPGPYICAEYKFAGYPYWLLNKPGIQFRVYNEPYVQAIAKWFSVLLPRIEPFMYKNGGPIITVQVENEYGAYDHATACDKKYLNFLLDQFKKYLGEDVIYFTMDNSNLKRFECGAIPGLLKAVDFGTGKDPKVWLQMLREFQPHGPFVNGEFWIGWFDKWGGSKHANKSAVIVAKRLDEMLQLKANVNFYMFHGGTNFGYTNGAAANTRLNYNARVTSYDYDSPLTESGDTTPKYFAIRNVMSKYVELPPDPVPPPSPKWKSPLINLDSSYFLFDELDKLSTCVTRTLPITMERFNQSDGFILYRLEWNGAINNISLYGVHDRAVVYIDEVRIGVVNRMESANGSVQPSADFKKQLMSLPDDVPHTISIFVENLGRVNHGYYRAFSRDYKGITIMVTVDGVNVNLKDWTVCPLPLNTVKPLLSQKTEIISLSVVRNTPMIFCGHFNTQNGNDTFLDPRGWGKGVAFLNDRNLGRYWPTAGPQVTLYVPGVYFNSGDNTLCLIEIDTWPHPATIQFIDQSILGEDSTQSLVEF